MIPDKIYVGINDLGSGYSVDISLSPEERHSEYIRKDALLEWTETELERLYALIPDASKVEDGIATPIEMRFLGQYMQMESIIDKINSL